MLNTVKATGRTVAALRRPVTAPVSINRRIRQPPKAAAVLHITHPDDTRHDPTCDYPEGDTTGNTPAAPRCPRRAAGAVTPFSHAVP